MNDLFEFNNRHQDDVGASHTCPKSAELMVDIVSRYAGRGETVLDIFGGSGSTLIACEKKGRRSLTMEIDPCYCDMIIQRWQNYTGEEAVNLATGATFNREVDDA